MKKVTFKVAKSIKESGYPQIGTGIWYDNKGRFTDGCSNDRHIICPTYLEVWLWLDKTKKILLEPIRNGCRIFMDNEVCDVKFIENDNFDLEESIIKAIEYLVDNNLIK